MNKLLAAMAIICLLVSPALVVADAPGGTGPDDALAPSGEWTSLTRGQEHWYALEYQGHQEMQPVEDGDDDEEEAVWTHSRIQVLLDSEPDDSIAFSVWTPENVRTWGLGEEMEPIGRGGKDKHAPGDLCWCGTFEEPGTYYVVVEHTGQGPETAYYSLEIRGRDVSFTAPAAVPAAAPAAASAAAAEPAAVADEPATGEDGSGAGRGPDNALFAGDGWIPIAGGETLWYVFDYRGHHEFEEDEDGEEVATWIATPAQIWLDSEPDASVVFDLLTQEQVRLWAQGEEFDPVGRGTENENEPGDLFWAGSLGTPGRYYVLVENQGAEPGSFRLNISGQDVSP
ncbi:MAG: hypothetical protein PVF77_16435 [Anaerolineae bacterium]|jgi:hypothetical protein